MWKVEFRGALMFLGFWAWAEYVTMLMQARFKELFWYCSINFGYLKLKTEHYLFIYKEIPNLNENSDMKIIHNDISKTA